MEEKGRGGAQRGRSLQTADTKTPPRISEQPTVQKCDQNNAEQLLCVCVRVLRKSVCIHTG